MRKHQEVGSPFCEGVIALGLFVPDATFAVQVLRNGVVYCGFWRLLAPESLGCEDVATWGEGEEVREEGGRGEGGDGGMGWEEKESIKGGIELKPLLKPCTNTAQRRTLQICTRMKITDINMKTLQGIETQC
ncbi:unnamed protein product [Boreogadus saida]